VLLLHRRAVDLPIPLDVAGLIDRCYWAVVTMSTIGYGDITPLSPLSRLLTTLWVPIAVIALADTTSEVQMIALRRQLRTTDYGASVEDVMLRDALRNVRHAAEAAHESDVYEQQYVERGESSVVLEREEFIQQLDIVEPSLSLTEFIVDQLVDRELVDAGSIAVIRRQFRHVTRGTTESDSTPVLTPRQAYEEIRERVRKAEPVSAGAEYMDVEFVAKGKYGGRFKWASYEQWYENSWKVRVAAKGEDVRRAASDSKMQKQKWGKYRSMG
jgi:hypothetical protein